MCFNNWESVLYLHTIWKYTAKMCDKVKIVWFIYSFETRARLGDVSRKAL